MTHPNIVKYYKTFLEGEAQFPHDNNNYSHPNQAGTRSFTGHALLGGPATSRYRSPPTMAAVHLVNKEGLRSRAGPLAQRPACDMESAAPRGPAVHRDGADRGRDAG